MREIALATDEDLARARVDPQFRHRLIADSLSLLLDGLARVRNHQIGGSHQQQIREGVDLAVKLAGILQRIEQARGAG